MPMSTIDPGNGLRSLTAPCPPGLALSTTDGFSVQGSLIVRD
jgi:hypothetical protein